MLHFVVHLLHDNQFTSGGLVLMLLGSLTVLLRELPATLWAALVRQTTLTLTVKDDDAAFQWVKQWFLEQEFLARVRRVDVDTTLRGTELALIPAPGTHLFWRGGRPFWVRFHRSEDTKLTSSRVPRRIEALTFQTPGRQQRFLRLFVEEIVVCHHRRDRQRSQLFLYDDYWNCVQAYAPRLLESIILRPGEKERLLEDVERFRASRPRYRALGVPYHRGYLFYGPPGTGKTSLVSGLADRFDLSIYVLNLSEMTDRSLKSAISEVPESSLVLLEDIDCMRPGARAGSAESSGGTALAGARTAVTLSGLLNVLDGFHAPENVIFVMTTNEIASLDPALLRPGRVDYRLFLGLAETSQKRELYHRFFPLHTDREAALFVDLHTADTMAEFQGRLLRLEQAEEAPELVSQ